MEIVSKHCIFNKCKITFRYRRAKALILIHKSEDPEYLEVISDLEKALKLDPTNEAIKLDLEELKSKQNKKSKKKPSDNTSNNNVQSFLSNPELKKEEEIKYAEEAPELNVLNE
jgi:hypothetical protein